MGNYNHKVDGITFDLENYKYDEEPEEELFKDVAQTLRILSKNNQICSFFYEDCGIYVMQHDNSDEEICENVLVWLTPDEYEYILQKR